MPRILCSTGIMGRLSEPMMSGGDFRHIDDKAQPKSREGRFHLFHFDAWRKSRTRFT